MRSLAEFKAKASDVAVVVLAALPFYGPLFEAWWRSAAFVRLWRGGLRIRDAWYLAGELLHQAIESVDLDLGDMPMPAEMVADELSYWREECR